MSKINLITSFSSVIGLVFGFLYGDITSTFAALVVLMLLDMITGIINGIMQKKLNSQILFEGLVKKIYELILISAGHMIDGALGFSLCMQTFIFFFIANEALSIIENSAKIGVPIPQRIIDILEQLKDENDKEGKKWKLKN